MAILDKMQVLQTAFKTSFCYANPDVEVAWGNAAFTPKPNKYWAKFQVLDGPSSQVSIGDENKAVHREAGVVVIQLFGPVGKGEGDLREIADKIAAVFRDKNLGSGVICRSPYATNLGVQGSYVQMNITVPYQCDTLYS